ncbi:hypothetical protein BB559_001643 [Furculomyces boomerangus]|uniref:Sphingomyelin synthase-like domain-containing protein n=2 Tax=Harpellales TaxID=61421 RepID=A0A2T9Z190_9FUNG|nr:hypothetical protein BB559_001643 [Furculomyces boomerangus]PVZ98903.1 hypothetical protein BB558_005108 [Smittium angustum]
MTISSAVIFLKNKLFKRLKVHWKLDKKSIAFVVCVVILFGLSYQFNNVMANVASKRSRQVFVDLGFRYVLPDVGFDAIPQIYMLWFTDLCVTVMIVLAVFNFLIYDRPWRFLSRFLLSWSVALVLRITTVATTSVPDPRLDCEFITGNVFTSVSLHRCGDAVYSGHTTVYAICFLTWFSFAPKNLFGRISTFLIGCLAIAGSVIIIANRAHYTIDVLLAWYISVGAWYSVAWVWFWQITKKGRLLALEFPLGVGRKHMSDSDNIVLDRLYHLGLDKKGNHVKYSSLLADKHFEMSPTPPNATQQV